MKYVLAICVCLVIGCGQGPTTVEARNDPPEPVEVAEVAKKPLPKDFESLKPLAEKGDAEAQNSLGRMYLNGEGVEQDFWEAATWTRKAADQGDAKAQNNLGFMYEYGQGVGQNFREAAKWFRKAAEQGFASAQFNLGSIYKVGKGVEQDYVTAYAWANIAEANGNKTAPKLKSEYLEKEMTPEQIAKAEALAKEMIAKNPKLLKK